MEIMGFERGEYATIMALTAGVSSATVSFSTPFAGNFKPRTLMITSQVLFLAADHPRCFTFMRFLCLVSR